MCIFAKENILIMKKELIILIIALFFITPSASYAYSLLIHKKSWKSTKTRTPINEPSVLLDNDGQILLYSEYGIYNKVKFLL